MKYTDKNSTKNSGSVLVVALVLSAIGTLGVLATVSIIGARSDLAEAELRGLDRRVRFNNSRALAKEVIYRNYLHKNTVLTADKTYDLGGWGEVTITAFDQAPMAFNDAARTHPTGAAPMRAFSQDVDVLLADGVGQHDWQYQLRSYNPALGGDLLSIHPTNETATEDVRIIGDLRVKGRAVFWPASYHTDNSAGVRSEEVIIPVTSGPNLILEDPDNNAILPANYVSYNQTIGNDPNGNHYSGELDILNNANSPNSYFQRLTNLGGEVLAAGGVTSTDGLGPDTVPPTLNDPVLLAAINDTTIDEAALVGQLAASGALSSNIMIATLNRAIPISDPYLIPLLNQQAPLPDDVLFALGAPTTPITTATRNQLLDNTSFSYISDGQGNLTVNLQSQNLFHLLAQDFTRITLRGQNNTTDATFAESLPPRVIAIENADNMLINNVSLLGVTNTRRIVLALSQTSVLDGADLINFDGSPSTAGTNATVFSFDSTDPFTQWRMITEMQGVSSIWDVSSVTSATMVGGIRTDHSIRINGDRLTLDQETEVEDLEVMVSRNAWIETYK